MFKGIKKFFKILITPNLWQVVIASFILVISFGMSFYLTLSSKTYFLFTYLCFAVYIISLIYLVYLSIRLYPRIKSILLNFLSKSKILYKIATSYSIRTMVYASFFFIINLGYAIFNLIIGIISKSYWYIILGGYYLVICFARFLVLNSTRKLYKTYRNENDLLIDKLKIYRRCGIYILLLDFVITAAIIAMTLGENPTNYTKLMFIIASIYTFIKMTLAIYNIIKAKKLNNPIVQALRNINLTTALVSLVSLNCTIVSLYSDLFDINVMNANVISFVISVCIVLISIKMIISSNIRINKILALKENDLSNINN